MANKLIATSFVVFALIASSPAFAATQPVQAVGGSNPRPQAVGGSNPRPQIDGSGTGGSDLLTAVQVYFGL